MLKPFWISTLRRGLGVAVGTAACLTVAATATPAAALDMTIATFHPRTGTADVESLFHFKELVEQRSGGKIQVKVFYGGTLGGERELVEQLKLGTVHLCLGGWATRGAYVKKIMPWGVPYLFSSQKQITATVKGRLGEEIRKAYEKEGIVWTGIYFRGNRQLTTNRVIKTPDDMVGMKIRLPEDPTWITVWKAFKTIPVPIPSPEVFSSLQTGVVEAQENPVSSNYSKKLWEVQKYTILTNHIVDMQSILLSKKFLDGVTPEQRDMLVKAAKETLDWANTFAAEQEGKLVADMKKHGMQFLSVDLKPFQKIALGTMDFFKQTWEPWVPEEVTKALQ